MDKKNLDWIRVGCRGGAAFAALFAMIGAIGTFATIGALMGTSSVKNTASAIQAFFVFNDFVRFGSMAAFVLALVVGAIDFLNNSKDKIMSIIFAGGASLGFVAVFLGSLGAILYGAAKRGSGAPLVVSAILALLAAMGNIAAFVLTFIPFIKSIVPPRPAPMPYGGQPYGQPPLQQPYGQPPMGQPYGQPQPPMQQPMMQQPMQAPMGQPMQPPMGQPPMQPPMGQPYGQPQPPMQQPVPQQFNPPAPPVQPAQPATGMPAGNWICINCGASNDASSNFCFGCGSKRS